MNHHRTKSDSAEPRARLRLRIRPAAEGELRSGHPWVFADSIREQNREAEAGELAVIYDRNDRFLAVGLFDPNSPIRVRVLHTGKPQTIDDAWWAGQLQRAMERRHGLFDDRTNGFRIINGESDGWPGLVLDRYGGTLVLKLYTAAWLPRLELITGLVRNHLTPERIVLRLSRNLANQTAEDGAILFGPPLSSAVTFLETGLHFEADVLRGQKTGFFLDQRENRRQVEQLAAGRTVLNAFSFSGGFSLYAARGGAKSVTDLDISAHALASAKRNFGLNSTDKRVQACRHECVQADAFDWLASHARRMFDLVVLDPPSFARRESERVTAIRAYGRLTELGIAHLNRSGILVACSCSAHVSADEFFDVARRAAKKSGRRFEELQTTRHAPDHPATFQQANYLKGIYLKFS